MATRTTLTDTPKRASEHDALGVDRYKEGLVKFIEKTSTPITIALQGEWGSGKTSLMYALRDDLCDQVGKRFIPIWLNTWQYSLLKSSSDVLISIIKGLTEEVFRISSSHDSKLDAAKKKVSVVFSRVIKASANVAFKATTGQDVNEILDIFDPEKREVTVLELKEALNEAIKELIEQENKAGIIFFIDDLDRIEPTIAVEILELLKNIFELENCVFILAIDYDVVVKGLEPKFGKLNEYNEREFRSFFDKIIQVPFAMPVSSYYIDDFLINSLTNIGYLSEEQNKNLDTISKLTEFSNLSVGTNPRALKRLINSLSLIKCINEIKEEGKDSSMSEDFQLIINFALVSIQIAYPPVYQVLVKEPGFTGWNNTLALRLNLKELDEQSKQKLKETPEFDEEWEQVLFRLCENDHYLKKRALNISRLLNVIREYIMLQEKDEKDAVKTVIQKLISLSSVTSLNADPSREVEYHKGSFLKNIRSKVMDALRLKMPEIKDLISERGARVQTNAVMNLGDKDWVKFHTFFKDGMICLQIQTAKGCGERLEGRGGFEQQMVDIGMWETVKQYANRYGQIMSEHPKFIFDPPLDRISVWEGWFIINFYSYLSLPTIESFYVTEIIDNISDMIKQQYSLLVGLDILGDEIQIKQGEVTNQI